MQTEGIRQDQITQVRGFADQRLRKPDNPLDSSNRRISLIVQYNQKLPELTVPKNGASPEGAVQSPGDKLEGQSPQPAEPKPSELKPQER